MDKPLVSIAIITFNQKEYLRECIESCLMQDYGNIEIVVADDCSTDGTQEMLLEYQESYPNKFVLRLSEKNSGITNNSNNAHFACSGKYIAWMGGDDLMLKEKISKQVSFMELNPECNISYHDLDVFDSDTNKTLFYFNEKNKINGKIAEVIRYGTFNGACSTMVRASKAPKSGFNVTLPVASDWLYWIESLADGGEIKYIDEVLGRYRRHSSNITRDRAEISQNELDHLVTCQILMTKFPEYFKNIIYSYSRKLISLRYKLKYVESVGTSFLLSPNFKSLIRLIVFYVTIGRVRI